MKTHRMSRSAEGRNTRKEMTARGRASLSRAALLAPDIVLGGSRFRRANRLTHADAALLDMSVRKPDGTLHRPEIALQIDERTRELLGYSLS